MPGCANAGVAKRIASSSVSAVVLAASIGIRASAKGYMRSGNSAMPVPNARMPEAHPHPVDQRIDVDLQVRDLCPHFVATERDVYKSSASVRRIATSVVGSCSCFRKNHLAGYRRVDLLSVGEHRNEVRRHHLFLAVVAAPSATCCAMCSGRS